MVAHITGHILVTFKWELADKLSFSIFQEKYDNQIEAHAIFNAPLSILVTPASLSASASSLPCPRLSRRSRFAKSENDQRLLWAEKQGKIRRRPMIVVSAL
jgi:hypothetical protein